jgi:hypothetical protein
MSLACATDKFCDLCGTLFHPRNSMQKLCGPVCGVKYAKGLQKDRKVKAKAERAQTRARKEKIKTIPDLIKEAQVAFNSYVRYRDREKPCICCGSPLGAGDVGGAYDCGHYRSTGSAPHLRFDERNAHAQNKRCNRWGAGRAVDYRIGLIDRIGLAAVEALESENAIHKWTREELIAIKNTYRAKRRELEKEKA